MKMTETQALTLGKKVLDDIEFVYHKKIPLKASYEADEKSYSHPEVKHGWYIMCKWFDEDWLDGKDRSAFLMIDDDNGKPIVLRARTGGGGNCVIDIDEKGKYYIKSYY